MDKFVIVLSKKRKTPEEYSLGPVLPLASPILFSKQYIAQKKREQKIFTGAERDLWIERLVRAYDKLCNDRELLNRYFRNCAPSLADVKKLCSLCSEAIASADPKITRVKKFAILYRFQHNIQL